MLKECVMGLGGEVAYVDFAMGQSEGWIRLQDENSGKVVVEKMKDNKVRSNCLFSNSCSIYRSNELGRHIISSFIFSSLSQMTINKGEVTFRVLEGEEEEKYLATVKETIKNLRSRNKNTKRGGRSRRGEQRAKKQ